MNRLSSEQRRAIRRTPGVGFFVGVAFVVAAGFAFVWQQKHPTSELDQMAKEIAVPSGPPAASNEPSAPSATEPVKAGETLLRDSARPLSRDETALSWLSQPDLLRRWVSATYLVFQGESPKPVLGFLRSKRAFMTTLRDGQLVASPDTEHRYDAAVQALQSFDPAQAAGVYTMVRPFAQTAFSEIALPGQVFDSVLRSALTRLATVAISRQSPEMRLSGAIYKYADPKLEGLSDAEKALLRLGPTNARAVQDWMSRFLRALPPAAA